jgi:hypothetical protein
METSVDGAVPNILRLRYNDGMASHPQ